MSHRGPTPRPTPNPASPLQSQTFQVRPLRHAAQRGRQRRRRLLLARARAAARRRQRRDHTAAALAQQVGQLRGQLPVQRGDLRKRTF